jgi:hypothetical protein
MSSVTSDGCRLSLWITDLKLVTPASKATNTGNLGLDLKNALRGLKSSNASAGDMTANFERLDRLTKNARAAGRLSRNKETIQTLLDGIKQRPKFGKMVEYGIECLKNLAVDEVSVEELLDEGVIEVCAPLLCRLLWRVPPFSYNLSRYSTDLFSRPRAFMCCIRCS